MASMFRTIEQEGGGRAPEWLSNHPNPGNRAEYITSEAQSLRVQNPIRNTQDFQTVQSHLGQMPPAPTTEEAARGVRTGANPAPSSTNTPRTSTRVEAPSSKMVTYNEGDVFRITVPVNWRELASESTVTFAPEGGYGETAGSSAFTHGVQAGISRVEDHGLEAATQELIAAFAQSNPRLARAGNAATVRIDGRSALRTQLTNVSQATGSRERILLYTTQMQDGALFFLVGVSPEGEWNTYQPVINRVVSSIRFLR
jgi:hypothetical protein